MSRLIAIIVPLAVVSVLGASPVPASASLSGGDLNGVSCPTATLCMAVGQSSQGYALAERWNGNTWHIQPTANPTGATSSVLYGVSCSAAAACTAVGGSNAPASGGILVERWNGTAWHIQSTPYPAGSSSILTGVSCPTAEDCTAVGFYLRNGVALSLAERWNGTAWHIQTTPNPAGTPNSELVGASCSSVAGCTAVGDYYNGTSNQSLAERWNGTAWRIQSTPNPTGTTGSDLRGVSCRTAGCTAVGYYNASAGPGPNLTLAERWNGSAWHIQSTPNPAGATGSELTGVSCTTARDCIAVGDYGNAGAASLTLAERWNGTAWHIQSTPNPTGATISLLNAVSCSAATACTAVGWDYTHGLTLAERWNGNAWQIQTTP
jgi:hypothetical protein